MFALHKKETHLGLDSYRSSNIGNTEHYASQAAAAPLIHCYYPITTATYSPFILRQDSTARWEEKTYKVEHFLVVQNKDDILQSDDLAEPFKLALKPHYALSHVNSAAEGIDVYKQNCHIIIQNSQTAEILFNDRSQVTVHNQTCSPETHMLELERCLRSDAEENSYITSIVRDDHSKKFIVTEHCLLTSSNVEKLQTKLALETDLNHFQATHFVESLGDNELQKAIERLTTIRTHTETHTHNQPLPTATTSQASCCSFQVLTGFVLALGISAVALAFTALLIGGVSPVAIHGLAVMGAVTTIGSLAFFAVHQLEANTTDVRRLERLANV